MLQAFGEFVVLKKIKEEQKKGSILLPNENTQTYYEVTSVLENEKSLKVGDKVVANYPQEIEISNEKYFISNKNQILAKLLK